MQIKLTQSQWATIDDEDWPLVKAHNWYALRNRNRFYAVTWICGSGTKRQLFMHKLILGIGPGQQGDHRDGNSLNNTRQNLRIATHAQNTWNRGSHQTKSRTAKQKGVFFDRTHGRFRAAIMHEGKRRWLGYFVTEEEAAAAYRKAEQELRGEWAWTAV